MGLIDSIFSNEKVLKTAFGMVKKLFTENDIQLVTLELGPDGEVLPQLYRDEKPVVIEQSKMTKIEEIMIEQAKAVSAYAEENALLKHRLAERSKETDSAVPEFPAPGLPAEQPIDNLLKQIDGTNADTEAV
jgi:hypothetical protein